MLCDENNTLWSESFAPTVIVTRTLPRLEEPTREVEVLPRKEAQEVKPKRFEIGMRNGGTGTEHAQANGTTVVSANRP